MSQYLESIHGELTERFGYHAAGPDPDRDHEEPPVVQRPDDRPAVHPHRRRLHRQGRRPGQPAAPPRSRSTGRGCSRTRSPTSSPSSRPSSTSPTGTPRPWPSRARGAPARRSGTSCCWSACRRAKLLNLDTINLGFIRPKEPDDRQLAYCQAQLYAQYMVKRFGPDALIKMLDAYRRGLTTDRAIDACFGVEKADFEDGVPRPTSTRWSRRSGPASTRRSRSSSRSSSGSSRRSPTTPT